MEGHLKDTGSHTKIVKPLPGSLSFYPEVISIFVSLDKGSKKCKPTMCLKRKSEKNC